MVILLISSLLYTPHALYNIMRGFCGCAWHSADLLVFISLILFSVSLHRLQHWRLAPAFFIGIAASFACGTGIAVWPAAVVLIFCTNRSLKLILASLISMGLIVAFYQTGQTDETGVTFHPIQIALSLLALAGSTITQHYFAASLCGSIAIALFGVLSYFAQKERREDWRLSFFMALGIYAIGAMGLTAIGRADYGEDYGFLQSRYAVLPALFWISLLIGLLDFFNTQLGDTGLVAKVFKQKAAVMKSWRQRAPIIWASVAAVVILSSYITSRAQFPAYKNTKNPQKDLFSLSVRLGLPFVGKQLFPKEDQEQASLIRLLKKTHHYPFNEHFTFDAGYLGTTLPKEKIIPPNPTEQKVFGMWDQALKTSDQLLKLGGWVFSGAQKIKTILVIDENRQVIGIALPGFERADIREKLAIQNSKLGWLGYANISAQPRHLDVVVQCQGQGSQDPENFYLLMANPKVPGQEKEVSPPPLSLTQL